jgi:hypothetical protein
MRQLHVPIAAGCMFDVIEYATDSEMSHDLK